MVLMRLTDAHIHLADRAEGFPHDRYELFCTCVAQHSQWKTQASFSYSNCVRFYGIHPWYAEEWTRDVSDELVSILENDRKAHVGEIGLDSKRGTMELEEKAFAEQLDIASEMDRCVNIHNIGCDGTLVSMLKRHGNGCRSIILHSFKNPDAHPFSGLECYFSLNPRLLTKSKTNVREIFRNLPKDRILLETDYPHVPKDFVSAEEFINRLASILGMSPEELSGTAADNLRRALE